MLGSQVYPEQCSPVVRWINLPITQEWTQLPVWDKVCQARHQLWGIVIHTMRLTDGQAHRSVDQLVGS